MTDHSPLALLVRKLNSHVALDETDKRALLDLPHNVRYFKAASHIVREGERPGACAILLKGFAYRQKLVENGSRQIVSFHIPGDALDMQQLYLDCADHNVQVLTEADVAMIPRSALRAIARERPTVAQAFAISAQIDASIAREWLLNVGRRDARQRVAHLLCEIAVRMDGQVLSAGYEFELPMSQEQLGDATGLTPVHINRTLKCLEGEGLIKRTKRMVQFPDWAALRRLAEFNPLYLHLSQQTGAC